MSFPLLPLRGVRCQRCEHVATPVQHFGCENCGGHGVDLVDTTLTGEGTVLNAVTVHRTASQSLRIGSVHLDEGPMLRALLSEHARAGVRVHATEAGEALVFAEFGEAL
ncbi:hypothetical protein [Nocardioides sp.]|uniref:hypothetical protein n=1 Tax=Nocardioides sp. TaxID=35761 RepID=UPI003D0F6F8F